MVYFLGSGLVCGWALGVGCGLGIGLDLVMFGLFVLFKLRTKRDHLCNLPKN